MDAGQIPSEKFDGGGLKQVQLLPRGIHDGWGHRGQNRAAQPDWKPRGGLVGGGTTDDDILPLLRGEGTADGSGGEVGRVAVLAEVAQEHPFQPGGQDF